VRAAPFHEFAAMVVAWTGEPAPQSFRRCLCSRSMSPR
jgi:hypothetical protein